MTNHTKGPWESHNGEVTTSQETGRSYRRIAVVQDYGVGSLPEVDEANAALIAAAPEMLEALEECVERFHAYKSVSISFPITEAKARAVIAKAKGELTLTGTDLPGMECVPGQTHLSSCDEDGYCNHCGSQELLPRDAGLPCFGGDAT